MADLMLTPDDPIAGTIGPGRVGRPDGDASLKIAVPRDLGLTAVTGRNGSEAALAECFWRRYRLTLPTGPRCTKSGAAVLVGLGPRRWLFIQPPGESLAEDLSSHAAICDVSDERIMLHLSGTCLPAVLAKGFPVDLHPSQFGPGHAASSVVGSISVLFWRLGDAYSLDIAVPRSLCGSFLDWLSSSAAEFGLEMAWP